MIRTNRINAGLTGLAASLILLAFAGDSVADTAPENALSRALVLQLPKDLEADPDAHYASEVVIDWTKGQELPPGRYLEGAILVQAWGDDVPSRLAYEIVLSQNDVLTPGDVVLAKGTVSLAAGGQARIPLQVVLPQDLEEAVHFLGVVFSGGEATGGAALELYDYPGEYAQRFDGVAPGRD
jgi:hypothetical protein